MITLNKINKFTFVFMLNWFLFLNPAVFAQDYECIFKGKVSIDGFPPPAGTVINLLKKNKSIIRKAIYKNTTGDYAVMALLSDTLVKGDSVFFQIVISDSAIIANTFGDPPIFDGNLLPNPPIIFNTSLFYYTEPLLISPSNNSLDQILPIKLEWNSVYNPNFYRLQVSADSAFRTILLDDSLLKLPNKVISNLRNNQQYYWRVQSINNYGQSRWSEIWNFVTEILTISDKETSLLPSFFSMEQNYPNPFNPSTVISYSIEKEGNYSLRVYNQLGSQIIELFNENKNPGNYRINIDASHLSAGIYFYELKGTSSSLVKKAILLK